MFVCLFVCLFILDINTIVFRWTAASSSEMSPAYSSNKNDVFTWVGIIMYLPSQLTDTQKEKITQNFRLYSKLISPLVEKYNGTVHWAKLELPPRTTAVCNNAVLAVDASTTAICNNAVLVVGAVDAVSTVGSVDAVGDSEYEKEVQMLRNVIGKKYPVKKYNQLRAALDPEECLSNDMMKSLF